MFPSATPARVTRHSGAVATEVVDEKSPWYQKNAVPSVAPAIAPPSEAVVLPKLPMVHFEEGLLVMSEAGFIHKLVNEGGKNEAWAMTLNIIRTDPVHIEYTSTLERIDLKEMRKHGGGKLDDVLSGLYKMTKRMERATEDKAYIAAA